MMTSLPTSHEIHERLKHIGTEPRHLIALLHAVQDAYHFLPQTGLEEISRMTGIALSTVCSTASFYNHFRFTPAGTHSIKICVGTACHVKGAEKLVDDFKRHLNIPEAADTDPDLLFTISRVACLGCCMLAPAVQIDDITYGSVASQDIGFILYDFLQSRALVPKQKPTKAAAHDSTASIKLCLCSSCTAAGAQILFQTFQERIEKENLPVALTEVGCTGASFQAPLVEITTSDERVFHYGMLKPDDVEHLLSEHFRAQHFLGRLRHGMYSLLERVIEETEPITITRYRHHARDNSADAYTSAQTRIATQYAGEMNPLDVDDYEARGGFKALRQCYHDHSPETILAQIKMSGLRGRGGAGFPTHLKWEAVRQSESQNKIIICNADEGDPGAFMDRMLLESFPFRVLEGMAIAAYTCGIRKGYIFLRSEYPLAVTRMQHAITLCQKEKRLDQLNLELIVSAGAFVCGEETAMLAAISGRRGNPRLRPPYPSERGLDGEPTLINNVETFAMLPWIMLNQPDAFRNLGTSASGGTKTFALAGKIVRGGLIEVSMGTPLRTIIEDIGGGVADNKTLKAVQIGGPAGGCIPASLLDTPVAYETLEDLGCIMGSGGMIVLDESDCMVDMAKYFMQFTRQESCGKCTFCRIGTKRMLELLETLTSRDAKPEHLAQLKIVAQSVKANSLCGLGRSAPNPVLFALQHFEEEFIAHSQGRCPAKKCRDLITYRVTKRCIGCTKCSQHCPVQAITPRPYQQQEIDQNLCTQCDLCRQVCPQNAIIRES